MSAFLRATGAVRSAPSARTPLSSNFFNAASPKRPMPSNSLRPSFFPSLRSLRQARPYSSGFRGGPLPELSVKKACVWGLIGVNSAIFGYAFYAREQAKAGYVQNFTNFMRHMTLNLTDVQNGRYWQIVTNVFTHTGLWHFAGNMVSFYYLGSFLVMTPIISPGRFMVITLGSGIAGSLLYLFNRRQKVQASGGRDYNRGLGFSGAIMGVSSVASCLYPAAKVQLYGIIPVPLWGLTLGYALYDGYYVNAENTRTAHAGHLGGLAFGLAYYLFRIRFRMF